MQKPTNIREKRVLTPINNNKVNPLKREREIESPRESHTKRRATESASVSLEAENPALQVRDVKRKSVKTSGSIQESPNKKTGSTKETRSREEFPKAELTVSFKEIGVDLKIEHASQKVQYVTLSVNDQTSPVKEKARDVLALPRQYCREKDYNRAIQAVDKELQVPGLDDKVKAELHYALALAEFMIGDDLYFRTDIALNAALTFRGLESESFCFREEKSKFYLRLCISLFGKRDYIRAEKAARLGIEVNHLEVIKSELYLNLGKACFLQRKYTEAEKAAKKALDFIRGYGQNGIESSNNSIKAELYLCLSSSCFSQKKYIEAEETAKKALDFISDNAISEDLSLFKGEFLGIREKCFELTKNELESNSMNLEHTEQERYSSQIEMVLNNMEDGQFYIPYGEIEKEEFQGLY